MSKTPVKIIDCTPTWSAIIPIYLQALQSGTQKGRQAAAEEITRMAKIADQYILAQKNGWLQIPEGEKS